METKDWILMVVPIISNGIDVSAAKNPESADAAFNNVVSYAGAAVNLD